MIQRSLITGAAGLVGFHTLIELLSTNEPNEIHCTTHSQRSKEELANKLELCELDTSQVILHTIDLENFAAVSELIDQIEPNVVYHTAAKVSLDERDGELMVRQNVNMTHFVVEALIDLKNRTQSNINPLLVHVSSVSAFGSNDQGVIDESTPFVNITNASPYARSKFLSQNDVLRAHKLGLNVVIINPSVIIGLTDKKGKMRLLFDFVRRGIPLYTSSEMGYVDVRDVALAMVRLTQWPPSWGQCYILNGATLAFREFITIFGSPFSRPQPKIKVTDWTVGMIEQIVWAWSRICGRQNSPIPRGYLTLKSRYDGSKIERTLPDFRYRAIEETALHIARNLQS